MSESEKEQSEDVVSRGGDGDDDGSGRTDDHRKKTKQKEHGCGGNLGKAKMVALFRFRKVEKQLRRRNKRAADPSSSSAGCLGKRGGGRGGGGGGGCYFCFRQTPTLDSPVESQTSDPNSPEFTYELLRALMEKNDFYSKECNPHIDKENTHEK